MAERLRRASASILSPKRTETSQKDIEMSWFVRQMLAVTCKSRNFAIHFGERDAI